MTGNDPQEPWYEHDHIGRGDHALGGLDRDANTVVTLASEGLDSDGNVQLLLITTDSIEVWSLETQELAFDFAHWQVRMLKKVPTFGLLIISNGPYRQRVEHRIRDTEASKITKHWENALTFSHTGPQVSPLSWRQDQFAYLLGRVVQGAAQAEHNLGSLLAWLDTPPGALGFNFNSEHFANHGGRLKRALFEQRVLSEERLKPPNKSPLLTNWAERYGRGAEHRNQLVHSMHLQAPPSQGLASNHLPQRRGSSSQIYVRSAYEAQTLTQIIRAFEAITEEARDTLIEIQEHRSREETINHILSRPVATQYPKFPPIPRIRN